MQMGVSPLTSVELISPATICLLAVLQVVIFLAYHTIII